VWKVSTTTNFTLFALLGFCSIPLKPIPVAAQSKAWVCGRSPAETVGSNPADGIDVCFCACCMLSGRGLCVDPQGRDDVGSSSVELSTAVTHLPCGPCTLHTILNILSCGPNMFSDNLQINNELYRYCIRCYHLFLNLGFVSPCIIIHLTFKNRASCI